MSHLCSNFSSNQICSELLHFCNVGYSTLTAWCDCLKENYKQVCSSGNETYFSFITYVIMMILFCLITFLCSLLCHGMIKSRRTNTPLPPPPYVFIPSSSPPSYQARKNVSTTEM
uniref:Uncharacterized protein n=1 Tax=viral metagenome TaxID=1070528 RepID=A0A6C0KTS6_9ZZZZ